MDVYTEVPERMPIIIEVPGARLHGMAKGGMVFHYWVFDQEVDFEPVLKGLSNDACHAPHWGIVLKGQMTLTYYDGTVQVVKEGQCCWVPAGHVPKAEAGTILFDVTTEKESSEVLDHARSIMAKMSG